jgi:N-acetylglucosaminyldiphosphoundecaprenol N-acetyl-beta-D-mannosaminyltransferase
LGKPTDGFFLKNINLMNEILFFDIKINPLSKSEFLDIIESNLKKGNQIIQNGLNAASINELVNNEKLKQAYKNSDLINIDGMSIVWVLRFMGFSIPERVACPDLANDILAMAEKNKFSVFLFGTKERNLLLCKENLRKNYPNLNIAGSRNGYYREEEESAIIDMINRTNADILLLGMPSPNKELFMEKYKDKLTSKYIFGVGGLFDILSGLKKRAPLWIQRIGMEWFYRFAQEPFRLWRRYLIGNIKFLILVNKEKSNIQKL